MGRSPAAIKGGLAIGYEEITAEPLREHASPAAEQTEGVLARALVSRRLATEL